MCVCVCVCSRLRRHVDLHSSCSGTASSTWTACRSARYRRLRGPIATRAQLLRQPPPPVRLVCLQQRYICCGFVSSFAVLNICFLLLLSVDGVLRSLCSSCQVGEASEVERTERTLSTTTPVKTAATSLAISPAEAPTSPVQLVNSMLFNMYVCNIKCISNLNITTGRQGIGGWENWTHNNSCDTRR